MKLSLIIQAVDRMTAPVRKMTAGARNLTTGLQKLRREGSPAARALDMVRGAAHRTAYGFGFLIGRTARLAGKGGLLAVRKSAQLATSALRGTLAVAKNLVLGGLALGGAAIGWTIGGSISKASDLEQLQVQLEGTEGSARDAARAMQWLRNFMRNSPVPMEQLTAGFLALRTQGLDPTKGAFNALSDAAFGSRHTFEEAIDAVAGAKRGEYDAIENFGITIERQGKAMVVSYDKAGRRIRRVTSEAKLAETAIEAMGQKFAGATKRQERTLAGLWATLKNMTTGFQLDIADAGFFDFVKGKVQQLLDWVKKLAKDGTLKRWAEGISDALVRAFTWAEKFVRDLDWKGAWADIKLVAGAIWDIARAIGRAWAAYRKGSLERERAVAESTANGWLVSDEKKAAARKRIKDIDAELNPTRAAPRTLVRGGSNWGQRNAAPAKVGGAIDIRIHTDPGTTATVERHSNANPAVPTRVVTRGTLMSMVS